MSISETVPTWKDISLPTFPTLEKDIATDVAIIGGGITGVLSAYLLAKEGKKVVLLEKDRLVGSTTAYTTGFITQVIDTNAQDLVEMFDEKEIKEIFASHGTARDFIEQVTKKEAIECEFVICPNYIFANTLREVGDLEIEYQTMRRLGFKVRKRSPEPLAFKHKEVLLLPNQAKFHPRKFLEGVVRALRETDVEIYEKSEVTLLEGGGPFNVRAKDASVQAEWVITATYHPFNNPSAVFMKKGMYESYIVEFAVPTGKYPEGIYEDMENPYHYFRVDKGKGGQKKDRLLLGGEDHRSELKLKSKSFAALLEYSEELFGKRYVVVRRWSGPIEEPVDGLPLIGEYAPKQLVATAFSGNGMTYGPIAAMLLRDLVMGKDNPWKRLYDPRRTPTLKQLWKKGRDYSEEFFRGAIKNALG
jgi:glycine/D-amino acid oxidase-like deaminating enzyme